MNDHDLLIKVATNVESMCKKIDKLDDKMESQSKFCRDVQESKGNKYVGKQLWMWVMGLFFTLVVGAYGFGMYNVKEHHAHSEDHSLHHKTEVIKALKE